MISAFIAAVSDRWVEQAGSMVSYGELGAEDDGTRSWPGHSRVTQLATSPAVRFSEFVGSMTEIHNARRGIASRSFVAPSLRQRVFPRRSKATP